MKEKLIKAIMDNTDDDLRVIDVLGLVEAIEEVFYPYTYKVDWAKLDPKKWGEE